MCRHNLANNLGTKCNPDSVIGHGVDEHTSTRAHTHTHINMEKAIVLFRKYQNLQAYKRTGDAVTNKYKRKRRSAGNMSW